jgi:thioredoxin reductase (NADPH)
MGKPVVMTIDDDPQVLRAVERDLKRRYGEKYRVVRADSGAAALEAVAKLKERGEAVALFLADQRMPGMTGVEFLEQAIRSFPTAKRALLTAYADTDAAIAAINTVHVSHYLMKPWDPPEQNLYPVVDDMLEEWSATFDAPFEGIRVVGHRWNKAAHEVKDFLARNLIPYRWVDVENPGEDAGLGEWGRAEPSVLPTVLLPDGTALSRPSLPELAEKIGLQTRAQREFYDLAIIGGGPAGLAAAVYGASEGLKTVLVEREAPGGQAGTSSRIENYLGFPSGLSGADLARRAVSQARRFGVEILAQSAKEICRAGGYRTVRFEDGGEIRCHSVLISTGVSYRKLDVPGLHELSGAGVYYGAAATEALNCTGQDVYVVGGANSAGQAAMFFSGFATRVVMLVRGDGLEKSMSRYLIDQIESTPNIELKIHTEVAAAHGEGSLSELTLKNNQSGEEERVGAAALFIFIGAQPRTDWLEGTVMRDKGGFVLAGPEVMKDGKPPHGWDLKRAPFLLETNVPGVFVAGDVRAGSIKRVASSVGEGSICVQMIHRYLAEIGA